MSFVTHASRHMLKKMFASVAACVVQVYTVNYGFVVAYTATVQPQDINGLPVGPAVDNFRGHLSYGISTGVIHYSNYTALAF